MPLRNCVCCAQNRVGAAPAVEVVQPHRSPHQLGRLPFVPGPNVCIYEPIRIAQNVDIHPPESRIIDPARRFHRGGQKVHVRKEPHSFRSGHLCQRFHVGVFTQEDTVVGLKLHVSDDPVSASHVFNTVGFSPRAAEPIQSPRQSIIAAPIRRRSAWPRPYAGR